MSATIPNADSGGAVYGFTKPDCQRISAGVKRLEGAILRGRGIAPLRGRWPVATSSDLIPALLTANLASGSYSSPTSATATTLQLNGAGPGQTSTGGTTITVYNTLNGSLSSGKNVWVKYWNGFFYVIQGSC